MELIIKIGRIDKKIATITWIKASYLADRSR